MHIYASSHEYFHHCQLLFWFTVLWHVPYMAYILFHMACYLISCMIIFIIYIVFPLFSYTIESYHSKQFTHHITLQQHISFIARIPMSSLHRNVWSCNAHSLVQLRCWNIISEHFLLTGISYISEPSLHRHLVRLLHFQSHYSLQAGFYVLELPSHLECNSLTFLAFAYRFHV